MTGGHARALGKEKALHNWISSLVQCLQKASPQDAAHFYQQIEKAKLDYSQNEYNSKRLEDFIQLYLLAEKEEDIVTSIIQLAGNKNIKLPEIKETDSAGCC